MGMGAPFPPTMCCMETIAQYLYDTETALRAQSFVRVCVSVCVCVCVYACERKSVWESVCAYALYFPEPNSCCSTFDNFS